MAESRAFRNEIAQLRPRLDQNSLSAEEIRGPAARVFNQLVHQTSSECSSEEISWELRIVKGLVGNAFSLPDGAVYVDEEMRQLLGSEPGLWAAVLAHEIVHITQHHWAKRAVFERSLTDTLASRFFVGSGAPLPMVTSSTAIDREQSLSNFSKQLELDADIGSLDLMARSGFHPDFATELYHLMEAQDGSSDARRFVASHPGWAIRESNLRKGYSAAVAEFEKLWPASPDSPGGVPPALAFVGMPSVKYSSGRTGAEIKLPIRCQNATGQLEVQLLFRRVRPLGIPAAEQNGKMEQTINCTCDESTLSFAISAAFAHEEAEADMYVMDSRGWVLARSSRITVHY